MSHSLIYDGYGLEGTEIKTFDPYFKNFSGRDYHLVPCSEAVDAGNNAFYDPFTEEDPSTNQLDFSPYNLDLDGMPRQQRGRVDLGCYENKGFQIAKEPGTFSTVTCFTHENVYYYEPETHNLVLATLYHPVGRQVWGHVSEGPVYLNNPFGTTDNRLGIIRRSWTVVDNMTTITEYVRFYYDPEDLKDIDESYTLNRFFHYKVNGQNAYDPNVDGYTTYEYSSASYATNGKFGSGIDRGLHYIEFQTRNFSSGSLATVMAALPVSLAAFEATDAENSVLLTWQTAEEKDVSHFSVELSPDGHEWQEIGQVLAAGFSESIRDYSYIDDLAPAVGVIFYRLKMVDNDGTFTYSPIRSVERSNMPLSDWQAWPNPVQDKLKVRISTPFRSYNLVNTLGQTVASGENRETDQVEINCSNLADGVYLLQLERLDGTMESKRIVKLK